MRHWGSSAWVVLLLAAAMITACGGNTQSTGVAGAGSNSNNKAQTNTRNTPPDNVRRVTVAELRDLIDQGKAVAVDVRGDEAYKQEHIKGALNVPENQVRARAEELPKDKLLAFYCS